MLLSFPSGLPVDDLIPREETLTVKSVDRSDFNKQLNGLLSEGWVISEVSSKFRKTLFGGITSYKAEFKRGSGV